MRLFTLASGRSGTRFLADFFHHNVKHCYSTHEPYLSLGNPTLFGAAIFYNAVEDDARLLPLLEQKRHFIQRIHQPFYLESNHALLKSAHRHFDRLADDAGLIHLQRNPLKVAKSELLREQFVRRLPLPGKVCRVNDTEFFRWSLTGLEPIFKPFDVTQLSRFQFYILQWLQIEQRAQAIIEQPQWHNRVFFIDVDAELNATSLQAMLDFFALPANKTLNLDLHRNKTPFVGDSHITAQDREECRQLLANLSKNNQQRLLAYL